MTAPEVSLVSDLDGLRSLESELWRLFERDARATPFQSPAWLLPWVEHFARDAELGVVVVRAGGRAVACLPMLFVERERCRTLCWIGQGISDYLDALVDPLAGAAALEAAGEALQGLAARAHAVLLSDLPAHSAFRAAFGALPGFRLQDCAACPRLPIDRDLDSYLQGLPRWLRRNLWQTETRLRRSGTLHWQSASARDLERRLDAFLELHAARWRGRGQPGVVADGPVKAFHRAAAPRLLMRGLLDLGCLLLDGRPIAAAYVLHRADAHLYLTGFDPQLERLSLGSLAIFHSLARAFQSRRCHYDFLRGREAYKYAWNAQDSVTAQLVCER